MRWLTVLLAAVSIVFFVAWQLWIYYDLYPPWRRADLFVMGFDLAVAAVGKFLVYDIWE